MASGTDVQDPQKTKAAIEHYERKLNNTMKLIKDEQTAKEGTQRNSERERKRDDGMKYFFAFWYLCIFKYFQNSIKGLSYKTIARLS